MVSFEGSMRVHAVTVRKEIDMEFKDQASQSQARVLPFQRL